MKPRKLRNRLAVASSLSAAAVAVALVGVVGLTTPASASGPAIPPAPAACATAGAPLAAISGIASTASNFTITLANTSGLGVGDSITLTGFTPPAYNSTFTIASLTSTTIVVTSVLNPGPTTVNGTGTVTGQTTIAPGAGSQQFGTYPNWLSCNMTVSSVDHTEGSDTTLFMMQAISNLYSQAGILPFSCPISSGNTGTCNIPGASNATQADLFDNYVASEQLQGINDVGSGNGIGELCNSGPNPPPGTTVDYSRSSKPPGIGNVCGAGNIGGIGYAKDDVIPMDFQSINPEAYMQAGDMAPGYVGTSFSSFCQTAVAVGCSSVGQTLTTPFPASGIGPVADGWLPGDPFTCGGTPTTCSGTPFNNMTNTVDPSSGGTGATSVAYRLFCQHGSSATPFQSQIMDWGNLTNLSAAANGGTAQAPGDGAPIGVPIRIIGVNTGSGTASTFYTFAQSGILGGTNCKGNTAGNPLGGSGNLDVNAASQGNPQIAQGPAGGAGNNEIALENDVNQVGDFAAANWQNFPGAGNADSADQAIDIATSFYFSSLGVYSTNSNAQVASIQIQPGASGGLIPAGQPSTFLASQMNANGVKGTPVNMLNNNYAMARTLFNVIRTDKLRASAAGFNNWLCDANSAFTKGQDRILGGNFDTDLNNLIDGQFGFQRVTDATAELNVAKLGALQDGIAGNNNGLCQANLKVASTGGVGTNTVTLSAAPPATVQVGWPVSVPAGSTVAIPANTVVLGISGAVVSLGATSGTTSTVAAGSNGGALANIASWGTPAAGELAVANASVFPAGGGVVQVQTSGGNAWVAYTGTDTVQNLLTGATFLSQASPGAATTVSTGGTVTLMTASNLVAGTGGSAPATLYFPGHPPVLFVTDPNT